MTMRLLRRGPVWAALLLIGAGCGEDDGGKWIQCTLADCADGLTLDFPRELAPGVWTFEIEADEMHWTCTATVPVEDREEPGCTGFDVHPRIDRTHGATPPFLLEGIDLAWAPEQVAITAFHEREQILQQAWDPTYDLLQPNGEQCGPTCRVAHIEVPIPSR